MVVARVFTAAPLGFEGRLIEVESHATKGLPSIQIVGLANKAIDEAKERVKSALLTSLLEYPARRITVNLAPAELPKDGTLYDLPIALAILIASGQLRQEDVAGAMFAGELALDGTIRPIKGAVSITETARTHAIETVYVPLQNLPQATLVAGVSIIGVSSLKELYLHLKKEIFITPEAPQVAEVPPAEVMSPLLDEIIGQEQAKRALIIAAAGRHNILFKGSPGTGKTMLAKTLVSLLPPLSPDEQLAVTKMHSLAGDDTEDVLRDRPFRAPHHTSSRISLVGGGTIPQPGEISLAHFGVLFLDELPEYPRTTLEALRQPLEDKKVSIARAKGKVSFPADFMLVATMNPCPCGYYGDSAKECICSAQQISQYQKRISGPLLDRIDLILTVPRVPSSVLSDTSMSSTQHKSAVNAIKNALSIQSQRYKSSDKYNNNLHNKEIFSLARLSSAAKTLLDRAVDSLRLSTRVYFKIIRVARTIADLESSPDILESHIAEALQYRQV